MKFGKRLRHYSTGCSASRSARLPFGHQLRALLHNLYALGMTEPGLFDLLKGSGIEISKGQVHNILMSESEKYQKASEEILTAGLKEAPYIRTDDTGAKHQHKSGYCTHIGGEYFAYYKTKRQPWGK